MRNKVVPHEEHLPFRAWRPFPNFTSFGETISLLFLSFTQYAFIAVIRSPSMISSAKPDLLDNHDSMI